MLPFVPSTSLISGIQPVILLPEPTKTFTNAAGCDSVATLNLTEKLPTVSTTNVSICTADFPYLWNTTSYPGAGTYTKTFTNAVGCDSIATLNLTEKLPTSSTTNITVCSTQLPYVWNGLTLNVAGSQSKTLTNALGCDSIATLNLTVHATSSSTTNLTICSTDLPYTWNGLTFNAADIQSKIFTNAVGCDSIATLNLTVYLLESPTLSQTICSSEIPFIWNGLTFNSAGSQLLTLCDSIVTLNLIVNSISSSTTNLTICSVDFPYTWNTTSYPVAGTYSKTFTNAVGCDSVATLVLTEKLPTASTTNISICTADFPYTWNMTSYPAAGSYTKTFTNAVGCDSVATLVLSEKLPTVSTTNVAICTADFPYLWNTISYPAAGTFTKTFTNSVGCDSVATLILTEKLPTVSTTNIAICTADFPYLWNMTSYPVAGTFTKTFTNAAGCDSVATLVLTEKLPTVSTTNITVCSSQLPFVWNGLTFNAAGNQSKTLVNALGCDSIATLNLTVNTTSSSTTNLTICSSGLPYMWNGLTFNAAGSKSKILVNSLGCDSIATLNLTVNSISSSTTNLTICSTDLPYLWNGLTFNAAGIQSKIFTNAVGCDSVATLNLTVNPLASPTISQTVCSSELPFVWNGLTFNTAGSKIVTLCDSLVTLNLIVNLTSSSTTNVAICTADFPYIWNTTSYPAVGTYSKTFSNAVGCDSLATLVLTEKLTTASTTSVAICSADFPYLWNATIYPAAGTFTMIFTNVVGCDSVATLVLTEKLPTVSTTNVAICSAAFPYIWNATSYPAAGTFTKTFTNVVGCDSVATLVLTEKLPTVSTTNVAICSAAFPYIWNATSYPAAGTYTKTFMNAAGCDSVATLVLTEKLATVSTTNVAICTADFPYNWNTTNYPVAGTYTKTFTNAADCDSVATLNLTEKFPTTSTTSVSICQGDSYLFNGIIYTAAGNYAANLINAVGCDSIATLNLTIKLPTSSTTSTEICQGDNYIFNGITYNTAGTYTTHLINTAGCDSAAILNLSIKLPTTSVTNASICQGDNYIFNGITYSISGIYNANLINAAGCDSTATLNLTIKLTTASTTNAAICQGDTYTFNGTTYNTAGTYAFHFINSQGCDSTATLMLKVKLPTTSMTNASICQGYSYTFNSIAFNTAGIYTYHFINKAGCDSTASLNLTVKIPTTSTTNASICQGDYYLFNGISYSTSGTYNVHLVNSKGCDSTAVLNLNVKLKTNSITKVSICQGDSYSFNGTGYTTAGIFDYHFINAAGCDSTATLELTVNFPSSSATNLTICSPELPYLWNGLTFNAAGSQSVTFTNVAGCDSIATLNLKVNSPTSSTTNQTICSSALPCFWNGLTFNSAGSQVATLTNAAGCDSIATLNLTVNVPNSSTTNQTICNSELPYSWNGLTFNVAGSQSVTLTNIAGCDSIATLNLTVNTTTSSTNERTVCPLALPFVWNGTSYTEAGSYAVHFTNTVGCDSIATLNLIVKSPLTSTTIDYVCPSALPYYWNNNFYNNTGTYTAFFISASGCDSVATLILTVSSPTSSTTNDEVDSSELPYVWNKMAYTESGTYTCPHSFINAVGCDSIAKLILKVNLSAGAVTNASICASDLPYIWNATSYTTSGTYTKTMTNVLGEDIEVTLNLTVNNAKSVTQTVRLFSGETYTINDNVYDQQGIYTDIIKTTSGCDSVVVTDLSFIVIPNTITPNGDGKNDVFMKDWHVKIYNRNGILLYDGSEGWDGKYKDRPVTKDTYFYVLYYMSELKTKSKEGYIMVIR